MDQTAWTRDEFLAQLKHHLRKLPQTEIDSAVEFYSEFIDEAGEDNEAASLSSLGSPREIAVQLMANRTLSELESAPPSPKRGLSVVWVVILVIFASPIALPLAAGAAALIIGIAAMLFALVVMLYIALIAIIVALFATCITLALGGLLYICLSLPLFFQSVASGFFYLGTGLLAAALGVMILPPCIRLVAALWRATAVLVGKHLPRLISKLIPRRRKHNDKTA